jgi:hypothetical protein
MLEIFQSRNLTFRFEMFIENKQFRGGGIVPRPIPLRYEFRIQSTCLLMYNNIHPK